MQLGTWLVRHHDTTAALIVEPLVQCAAGMAMYHPEYLRQARVLCDQYQVHLIADESATGFGRTGTMFAHEQAGIRPDFICLSRALTGGTLPLSAVLTNDAVYEAFYDDEAPWAFLHSDSYTANPLACRAALATLELFEREDTLRRNSELAQALDEAFVCVSTHPRVRNSRRLGMIWAWDISDAPAGFSRTFALRALSHGVLLRPIGNTVYAMPPYVLNRGELQHLAEATHAALVDTLEGTRA
jgi:adenosylmethionine---8-amino-7-oxononanoate aminotransferase